MEKFLQFIVKSSADPSRTSATIKGLLLANVGVLLFVIQYFNLPYTSDEVVESIGLFAGFAGAALSAFGMLRKLYFLIGKCKAK